MPWSWRHDHGPPVVQRSHDDRTTGERVADAVARFGGSWPFIFVFLGLIAGWMIINTLLLQRGLGRKPFDAYPYIALNLVLSGLAGIQAPVILMSQNRAAARDEALAAHHYQEGEKMERLAETTQSLLQQNTELTEQVHDLAAQIHQLTLHIEQTVASSAS
jgi:uncharacterized membrane protein